MMVIDRATGTIGHHRFDDLPDFLAAEDLVVVNDTRVIPARVYGRKEDTGGRVELFFLEEKHDKHWEILLCASKRPKPGQRILFGEDDEAIATLVEDLDRGRCRVAVESERPVVAVLERAGEPPLPPYIERAELQGEDRDRYQTVFAREPGAVAAPTAGLHFTPEIFAALNAKNVRQAAVTLHVGLGTFRPVTVENLEDHEMEAERYRLEADCAERINACRDAGGKILAVGSTSLRTLETVAPQGFPVQPAEGRSDLYIFPPYTFGLVDRLLTNFHLPESTLIMLVCAFGGTELIMEAYHKAIEQKYRFYSYGDCMLVL